MSTIWATGPPQAKIPNWEKKNQKIHRIDSCGTRELSLYSASSDWCVRRTWFEVVCSGGDFSISWGVTTLMDVNVCGHKQEHAEDMILKNG